jgi:hypothetical protein
MRTNGAASQFKQPVGSVRRVVIDIKGHFERQRAGSQLGQAPCDGVLAVGNRLRKAVGAALNAPLFLHLRARVYGLRSCNGHRILV